MLRRSFLLSFLAFAGTIAGAVELPKAYSPEAQAVREAAALRQKGDRLQEQGFAEEAREAWRQAIEAYRRAGYPAGEGEVFFQIGVSYRVEMVKNPGAMIPMLDAMAAGTAVLAEFLDAIARELGARSSGADPEAEALLEQASRLAQAGDCMGALPLFEAAGRRYAAAGPGTGELRALAGRLHCLQTKEEDPLSAMAFLTTLQEFMRVAQELKGQLKAGPAVRYLRAAESAELGKWQEAETLLRSVLPELEAAGDAVGASRTALDLGCVLVRQGKPADAEPFLQRAREAFAGWNDAACQPTPAPSSERQTAMSQEPPLPEPAGLSPRARARREGVFLLGQGDRLAEAGRLAAAREAWQAAAEAFQRAEKLWDLSEAYFRLGDSYASTTVMEESKRWLFLDYYDQAMTALLQAYETDVREEVGPVRQVEEIRSLFRTVRSRALSGDFAGAMDAAFRALPLVDALPLGSPATELESEADELWESGQWREARNLYQDLFCRSERDRDVRGTALALVGLGRVESLLGNPSNAEILLQRAQGLLPLVDEESGENREAVALEHLAGVFFSTGRIEEGMAAFRQARQAFAAAGRPEREAKSLLRLGQELAMNGEKAAALSALDEAEALLGRLPRDPEASGDLAAAKAVLEFQQGKFQDALSLLFKAQDLFRQAGSSRKQTGILFVIGGLGEFLGREEAATLYEKVDALAEGAYSSLPSQLVRFSRFASLVQHDRFKEAVDLGRELLAGVEKSEDGNPEAMIRLLLAFSYWGLDRKAEARGELDAISRLIPQGFGENFTIFTQVFARTFAKADSLLDIANQLPEASVDDPRVSPLLNEFAKSLGQDVKVLGSAGRQVGAEVLESAGRQVGAGMDVGLQFFRLLESLIQRDVEGSRQRMDETVALLDRWAEGLTLGELKAPFLSRNQWIYAKAVEMSLGQPEEAFRYAEEARARAFLDGIGNQKIDARYGANSELLRQERQLRLQLDRLKRDLRSEQRKGLQDQNPERLANLQRSLEQAAKDWEELGLRLKVTNPEYASLVSVAPASLREIQGQVLDGKTTLVEYFVPPEDGGRVLAWVIDRGRFVLVPLRMTAGDLKNRVELFRKLIAAGQPVESLAAELYGDLFAPLAEHVRHRNLVIIPHGVLHFLPFAALWDGKGYLGDAYALSYSPSATALKLAREKKAAAVGPILAVGNPDGSLEHAAAEAEAVARRYGAQPLLGAVASEGAVVAQAGQAGILHLAVHAVLNPVNPLFTRIELAPDEGHDGSLEMHEVFGLDLSKTGLVVLSACRTQLGRLTAGDEIEGLTRAFLYAGTPAVMSSLWDVQDDSTSFLMERFYTHLRRGQGRAEALRRAQIETRRRHPHPYHWAAFVLTGDGR